MFTSSPVRGFRPIPVLRGLTLNTPKRRNSMRCPRPRALFSDSKTVSTACSALVRLMFGEVAFTTAFTMSNLITQASSFYPLADARGYAAGCQDVTGTLHWLDFFLQWKTREGSRG